MGSDPSSHPNQPESDDKEQLLEDNESFGEPFRPPGIPPPLDPQGRLHIPRNRLVEGLHIPKEVEIIDPRFHRYARSYLTQAVLAAVAMLAVLVFVDSLSDAALAAGLGSSVLIIFLHPSNSSAKGRSLIGGHAIALGIGSIVALVWFAAPMQSWVGDSGFLFDLSLAVSLGLAILVMAITDTEHPPAAGTVLGTASQVFDWKTSLIIIGAVLLLAVIQRFLSSYLRDLI